MALVGLRSPKIRPITDARQRGEVYIYKQYSPLLPFTNAKKEATIGPFPFKWGASRFLAPSSPATLVSVQSALPSQVPATPLEETALTTSFSRLSTSSSPAASPRDSPKLEDSFSLPQYLESPSQKKEAPHTLGWANFFKAPEKPHHQCQDQLSPLKGQHL